MTAPLSGITGPETSAAEQSRMELQAKLNGLGGLNGRKLDPEAKAKKLREACEGFESIFIQKMWQEMRNSVPKGGLLTGREEKFWQDMYDQELSKSMTKAGGIGLADMMYEQLSRNLVSASRSAAGSAVGGVFTPDAAPLVPQAGQFAQNGIPAQSDANALNPEKLAASIYDGEAAASGEIVGEGGQAQPAQPAASGAAQVVAAAQPVQASQPVQPAQPAPLTVEKVAQPQAAVKVQRERKHVHKADLGQSSGLLQAQKAKREAGDKLGSRAVRQASQRKQPAQQVETQPVLTGLNQGEFRPGSAEALRAAVDMARTGAAAEITSQPLNLAGLVANVQAMNSQTASQAVAANQSGQPVQTAQADQANQAEPVVRKVRYSTNVPKKSPDSKEAKQAIRMLNVDNVGVNSKQGKGLAAYHAQQAEAGQAAQTQPAHMQSVQTQPLQAASAVIPPLTAASQAPAEAEANFAIPPLTASDSRG